MSSIASPHTRYNTADSVWFYALGMVTACGGVGVSLKANAAEEARKEAEREVVADVATPSGLGLVPEEGGGGAGGVAEYPEALLVLQKRVFWGYVVVLGATLVLGVVASVFFVVHASDRNVLERRCQVGLESGKDCVEEKDRLRDAIIRLAVYTGFTLLVVRPLGSWLVAHKGYVADDETLHDLGDSKSDVAAALAQARKGGNGSSSALSPSPRPGSATAVMRQTTAPSAGHGAGRSGNTLAVSGGVSGKDMARTR